MMRNIFARVIGTAALVAGLILTQASQAAPIQYTVNQVFGPGGIGLVTGTFITDGTIGTLTAANFLDWNLQLNDGTATGQIIKGVNASTLVILGTPVTASLTTLTYNYSLGPVNILDIYETLGPNHLCYTSFSNCFGPPGVGTHQVGGDGQLVYSPQSGIQVIAFGGTPVSTPGPAALALLGLGLAGLGATRRRR